MNGWTEKQETEFNELAESAISAVYEVQEHRSTAAAEAAIVYLAKILALLE